MKLSEAQCRVLNAARAGADIYHPYDRSGGRVIVNPAGESFAPYYIQYRTLDALLELGLLKEKDDYPGFFEDSDCHYVFVK
jgi:hypothetical protein